MANIDIASLMNTEVSFDTREIPEFYYLRGYTERSEKLDPLWTDSRTPTRSKAAPKPKSSSSTGQ